MTTCTECGIALDDLGVAECYTHAKHDASLRLTHPGKLYRAFMEAGGVAQFRTYGWYFRFYVMPPFDWRLKLEDAVPLTIDYSARLDWKHEDGMWTYWVTVDGIAITERWRTHSPPEAYLPRQR